MKIEFRNTSHAGNNLRTEMYFNDIRAAEIHCTPAEFKQFTESLYNPINPVTIEMDPVAEELV